MNIKLYIGALVKIGSSMYLSRKYTGVEMNANHTRQGILRLSSYAVNTNFPLWLIEVQGLCTLNCASLRPCMRQLLLLHTSYCSLQYQYIIQVPIKKRQLKCVWCGMLKNFKGPLKTEGRILYFWIIWSNMSQPVAFGYHFHAFLTWWDGPL